MPNRPDTRNSAYNRMWPAWQLVSDCYGGTRAIRAKSKKYLPQFPAEKDHQYQARLMRSVFYNAFARTVEGLAGLAFRKPPRLGEDVPQELVGMLERADDAGQNWVVALKQALTSAIRDGHTLLFVDYPVLPQKTETAADARGRKPYLIHYEAAQLLNWRWSTGNGQKVLDRVTIQECVTGANPENEFEDIEKVRFRVIYPDGWELFELGENNSLVTIDGGETTIGVIPIVPIYGKRIGDFESLPPLEDLAHLNLLHYQTQSDQMELTHSTCVPVWAAIGRTNTKEGLELSGKKLVDIPIGGDLKVVEVAGSSLDFIEKKLDAFRRDMAELGLSMLAKKPTNTATERLIDSAQESSELATMVQSCADGFESVLGWMAKYAQLGDNGGSVNFAPDAVMPLDPQKITAYSGMVAAGQISIDTLWTILQRAGELPDEFNPEAERKLLKNQAKTVPASS